VSLVVRALLHGGSVALSRTQSHSVALNRTQSQSVRTCTAEPSISLAISGTQWQSVAISAHLHGGALDLVGQNLRLLDHAEISRGGLVLHLRVHRLGAPAPVRVFTVTLSRTQSHSVALSRNRSHSVRTGAGTRPSACPAGRA